MPVMRLPAGCRLSLVMWMQRLIVVAMKAREERGEGVQNRELALSRVFKGTRKDEPQGLEIGGASLGMMAFR